MIREGYAAGYVDGEWLTIPGSAYRSHDVVHATREEAQAWRAARPSIADQLEVRRVRRTWHPGVTLTAEAFRIVGDRP